MKIILSTSLTTVILAATLVTGCAATVKPVTTPNGKAGFYIACDGSTDDWTTCFAEAANSCKGKYTIVDKNESSTPTAYGPLVRRNLIVECKN